MKDKKSPWYWIPTVYAAEGLPNIIGIHSRPGAEMVPIVEENGLVIGQAARMDVHGGTRLLHPVIHLHILNREGELFIQRRSYHKRTFPGKWDTAVGGHIDYGELLETALFREAAEELGFCGFNPIYLKTYLWESPCRHSRPELCNSHNAGWGRDNSTLCGRIH